MEGSRVSLAQSPISIPNLDTIAADPTRVAALRPEIRAALAGRAVGLLTELTRDMTSPEAAELAPRLAALHDTVLIQATRPAPAWEASADSSVTEGDHLLSVEVAAHKMGVSPDWIYRRSNGDRRLPFLARLDGKLLCSAQGVERYIRQRVGR
jgi:hypothetical protein